MAGQEAHNFDIEAEIAKFLADTTRSSLELPHMTTGQRKHAKRVAEQHSELKCESFGFGPERKLHLIKKPDTSEGKSQSATCGVNVKNTFIDDWIVAAQGGESLEPIVFRSMPPQLQPKDVDSSFTPVVDLEPAETDYASQASWERRRPRAASPGCSTTASEASVVPGSPSSCHSKEAARAEPTILPPPGLPLPPGLKEQLRVRNTFIHVDTPSVDAVPQRVVQSMPHGMFGRMLLAEKNQVETVMPSADDVAVPARPVQQTVPVLAMGSEVVIEGLSKLPAFNGLTGSVQSLDAETGRYTVLFASPVNGHTTAKVKRENLCAVLPAMPSPPMFGTTAVGVAAPQVEAGSRSASQEKPERPVLRLTALV